MTTAAEMYEMLAENRRLRSACRRSLSGHPKRSMTDWLSLLAEMPGTREVPDVYGQGGPVDDLQVRVADLLGKPAARFVIKGVIAQQAVLRAWTERSGRSAVAVHPRSHVDMDEMGAYERLHPLRPIRLGGHAPFTVADLEAVGEPLGAVTMELPLRRAGYLLPEWSELVDVSQWCRDRGVPLHIDGARLWESAPYYGKSLAELAALADSVYVSFYKGLGGLAGCALAGGEDILSAAGPWLERHGSNVFAVFPYALAALHGLDTQLPRMGEYRDRAQSLAAALGAVPGVVVGSTQTNSFALFLPGHPDALRRAHRDLAKARDVWLFGNFESTPVPDLVKVEVQVGESTGAVTDQEAADLVGELVSLAAALD